MSSGDDMTPLGCCSYSVTGCLNNLGHVTVLQLLACTGGQKSLPYSSIERLYFCINKDHAPGTLTASAVTLGPWQDPRGWPRSPTGSYRSREQLWDLVSLWHHHVTAQPRMAGGDRRRKGKNVPAGGHSEQIDVQTPRVSGSATDPKSFPYLRSLVSAVLKQRQSSGPVPLLEG